MIAISHIQYIFTIATINHQQDQTQEVRNAPVSIAIARHTEKVFPSEARRQATVQQGLPFDST